MPPQDTTCAALLTPGYLMGFAKPITSTDAFWLAAQCARHCKPIAHKIAAHLHTSLHHNCKRHGNPLAHTIAPHLHTPSHPNALLHPPSAHHGTLHGTTPPPTLLTRGAQRPAEAILHSPTQRCNCFRRVRILRGIYPQQHPHHARPVQWVEFDHAVDPSPLGPAAAKGTSVAGGFLCPLVYVCTRIASESHVVGSPLNAGSKSSKPLET